MGCRRLPPLGCPPAPALPLLLRLAQDSQGSSLWLGQAAGGGGRAPWGSVHCLPPRNTAPGGTWAAGGGRLWK